MSPSQISKLFTFLADNINWIASILLSPGDVVTTEGVLDGDNDDSASEYPDVAEGDGTEEGGNATLNCSPRLKPDEPDGGRVAGGDSRMYRGDAVSLEVFSVDSDGTMYSSTTNGCSMSESWSSWKRGISKDW